MKKNHIKIIGTIGLCMVLAMILITIADIYNTKFNVETTSENIAISTVNSCTKLPKTEGEINIVTYNIGDDQKACEGCDPAVRMKALMDILEANHADIIALQEVRFRKKDSTELFSDAKPLMDIIKDRYHYIYRAHGDDKYTTKGSPNQGWDYGNMFVSKFPIKLDSYKEYLIDRRVGDGEGQRYFFSVIIDTPQGPVRIYNIHTRAKESAWGVTEAAKFLKSLVSTEPSMPLIVLGDFNKGMGYIQSQFGDPQYALNISYDCSNQTACWGGGIDLIFPNEKATLLNRCQGGTRSNGIIISGGHVPVYGTFKLLNPITPALTPIPSVPTPAPSVIPSASIAVSIVPSPLSSPDPNEKAKYDLSPDAKIDITDFQIFVNYYKNADCKIDYNNNNNCRDIEDFVLFSNYYKTSNFKNI